MSVRPFSPRTAAPSPRALALSPLAPRPARADPLPVTGVYTRLALDPAAAAALTSLGVRVRPSTAATVDERAASSSPSPAVR